MKALLMGFEECTARLQSHNLNGNLPWTKPRGDFDPRNTKKIHAVYIIADKVMMIS